MRVTTDTESVASRTLPDNPLLEHVSQELAQSEHTVRDEAIARAAVFEPTHGRVTVLLRGELPPARFGAWHEIFTIESLV